MSIYCTSYQFRLPVYVSCAPDDQEALEWSPGAYALGTPGRPVRKRWIEVFCQHIPNHINEENGYDAPWLPAFVHRPGCSRLWVRGMQCECDCGDRAVFIIDEDHDEKEGQRYVNPLLVLTGIEYAALPFGALMERIAEALEARFRD